MLVKENNTEIHPCNGGMAGTVEDEVSSDVSCRGSGLRLAKTEVGTRNFIVDVAAVAFINIEFINN